MSEITDLAQQVADLTTSTTELTSTVVGQMGRLSDAADRAEDKAGESAASAVQAGDSAVEANYYVGQAEVAADRALQTVTGDMGSVVSAPYKMPVADANGEIDPNWLSSTASTETAFALSEVAKVAEEQLYVASGNFKQNILLNKLSKRILEG